MTILKLGQRTCPKCNSNWDGGSIVDTFIKQRDEGSTYWKGKSDEDIKEYVEGWTTEKVDNYIKNIKNNEIKEKALTLNQNSDKWDLCRYLHENFNIYILGSYSRPYTWGREIGIELAYDHPNHYDGVSYWQCPDCKTTFNRFTGKEEEIK